MMESANTKNDDLIVRHLSGEASPEEQAQLQSLLKTNSSFRQLYREYQFIWEQSTLTEDAVKHDWQLIRQRIGFSSQKQSSPFAFLLRIAAVLTLILSVSAGLWVYWNVPGYGRWVVFETGMVSDSIVLPDASIVFLNRNSSLKFRQAFKGEERKVALNGEGYFEVKPDHLRPFSVEVGPVSVKVVGTAFHVNASRNDGVVELNVTEGRVSLKNAKDEITVDKGEWALASIHAIGKGHAKNENFLSWKTGRLDFNKSSLNEIALALTQHFDEIKSFRIEEKSNILVTTRFNGESLEDITDELSVHFQKKFILNNGVLIISD
jgi:ferric-dicitrate binding protein FerR (iron transport regulator)